MFDHGYLTNSIFVDLDHIYFQRVTHNGTMFSVLVSLLPISVLRIFSLAHLCDVFVVFFATD